MASIKNPSTSIHFFNDALNVIKLNGATIMKLLEQEDYSKSVALKLLQTASELFQVLTNSYPPKPYYTLFSEIQLYIQPLQMYLVDYQKYQHDLEDIYELVQYVPLALPRLYLMVTVASSMSIHNHKYPSKIAISDKIIIEEVMAMSKAIQHSIRGLFLRHYLSISFKHSLDSTEGFDMADKVQFIINNLVQMIMLWIRWQHHGYTPDVRQDERQQLTTLIGVHFQRLTQLNFGIEYYSSSVLPSLLNEIVNTQDDLAQDYLLQVIMDGFPINFQLATLHQVLASVAKCKINIKKTILTMLTTFTHRFSELKEEEKTLNLFDVFWPQVDQIMKNRNDVSALDISEINLAMFRLVVAFYPKETGYLTSVVAGLINYLKDRQIEINVWDNFSDCIKLLIDDFGFDVMCKLTVEQLLDAFPVRHQMMIAICIIHKLSESPKKYVISDSEKLTKFLLLTKSLFNKRPELPTSDTITFCRFLHKIGNENIDVHFMVYVTHLASFYY
eukprot:NODE_928_length_3036_cov_0.345931.p1 type:complete len:501 gc:universal NODE_928_length_3036_cov_0.345931:114-1616(+)